MRTALRRERVCHCGLRTQRAAVQGWVYDRFPAVPLVVKQAVACWTREGDLIGCCETALQTSRTPERAIKSPPGAAPILSRRRREYCARYQCHRRMVELYKGVLDRVPVARSPQSIRGMYVSLSRLPFSGEQKSLATERVDVGPHFYESALAPLFPSYTGACSLLRAYFARQQLLVPFLTVE